MIFPVICGGAAAGEFVPPAAYPMRRYEAGWSKNPFLLKAAPIAVQKESFAKDMALAGWRQAEDDITVLLVNTKTREYTRLKNNEPAPDGMKVKCAHLEDRRADTFVEIERGGEVATLRYDDAFLRQMAATASAAKPQAQPANNPVLGPNGVAMNTLPPLPVLPAEQSAILSAILPPA